ncbi:MAG: protein translocase subunit SecF [Gemmatimonadales bacterium]
MLRLFAHANYDFIGLRRWAYGLTAAFIVPGFALLLYRGLNYSIEFTGGTLIQIRTATPVGTGAIRSALEAGGLPGAEIQSFGSETEYVIRARLSPGAPGPVDTVAGTQETVAAVERALDTGLGAGRYEVLRTEAVGPKVGRELQERAFIAILLSFLVTLAYLAVRFEWRFGVAAVLATAHDIAATIAFIRYLDLEVSLVVVAAVLTIVGYSLNDTIVIFDRVRENLRKFRRQNLYEILNLSINETLPRTILTGGTTMLTALALAFIAGEVIRPFALVMAFGILTGTFSSIYVAAPVLLWIENRWPGEDSRGARLFTGRPAATAPVPTPASPSPAAPGAPARPKAAV